jgi:hypothetical protein
MHRLPSQSSVVRFRVAAILLLVKWVVFVGALGLLGYSILMNQIQLTYAGLGLLGLAVVAALVQWVVGARARCPLCLVPSFSSRQCSKNRKARHVMGSYRLYVALAVIFRGYFHCPYCGEPTAIEVRQRVRNHRR